MKIVFNKSYYEKIKRIRALSKPYEEFLRGVGRADADRFIKIFRDGLSKNLFGLTPLVNSTVKQKKRMGYPRPRTPLFGKGKSEKDSLVNVYERVEDNKGIRIEARKEKHHKANLNLDVLLKIHTMGALMSRYGKDGKLHVWRIPKRPAALIAMKIFGWEKYQKKKLMEIKELIVNYAMKKDLSILDKYKEKK